jgi:hypothetical protein
MRARADTVDVVVVVQPTQVFRIDFDRLTGPASAGARIALVTEPREAPSLDGRKLAWVATTTEFDADSISRILHERGATGPGVRLVTGIETAVRACARAREALGLAGATEAEVDPFLDKRVMKERLGRHAPDLLPAWCLAPATPTEPAHSDIDRIVEALGLPVIAKPVDGVGSDGVRRLDDRAAIARFLRTPRARSFELDELLAGPVFNADAVIHKGQVRWFGVCELMHPPAEVLAGATFASWTLPAHHHDLLALRRVTERVLTALDPPDGAIHLEAVKTRAGFRFLEIACRNAGWLIPDAYEAAEGVDLRVAHLHAAAGLQPDVRRLRARAAGYFGAIRTERGSIARRIGPAVGISHRIAHREGRGGTAASHAIMLADLLCEIVAWHDDHERVRDVLRSLDGFKPFVLDT